MKSTKLLKKIKSYALASFLVPLIAVNSCLLIYKYMGDLKIKAYPNLNWNQDEHSYAFEEYNLKLDDRESHRFTFCPKHEFSVFYTTIDNQILADTGLNHPMLKNLRNSNKIKSVTLKKGKVLNEFCIKNHQANPLIKKFSW